MSAVVKREYAAVKEESGVIKRDPAVIRFIGSEVSCQKKSIHTNHCINDIT